jgi:hypothetical protein
MIIDRPPRITAAMTTFCSCLHTAEAHGFNGQGRCSCRRSRQRVAEGPDHLKDAGALAAARAKRRNPPA